MTVNRYDAPAGDIAVLDTSEGGCKGCKYGGSSTNCTAPCEAQAGCSIFSRKDKQSVIFKNYPIILNTTGKPPKVPEWAKEYVVYWRNHNGVLQISKSEVRHLSLYDPAWCFDFDCLSPIIGVEFLV